MTHDPLCPYREGPKWNEKCPQCDLIAKVRADERERAITILSNFTARFIEDARGGVA